MLPRIFIGSSKEGLSIAYEIQAALQYDAWVHVWTQDIFKLSNNTLDDLFSAVANHEFGIFIFTADDIAKIRNKTYQVARDNVVFELGFFISKLGKNNVFYLVPDNQKLHIPTDLLGIKPGFFSNDENIRAAVGPFCTEVRKIIKKTIVAIENLGVAKEGFFGDFLETFKQLFVSSKEINLFFIHSRSWRESHHNAIKKFLSDKERKIRVYLPDFLDKKFMEVIQSNFDDGAYIGYTTDVDPSSPI
jgi:hypothetical protein